MMAEVVFLGTGNAFSAGRRGNLALLIEGSGFRMLVEAGPVIMEQLTRANLQAPDIEFLFVSHSHGDHTLGFPMLTLNRLWASNSLHVYAGSHTIAILQTLGALMFSNLKPHPMNIQWHGLSEQDPDETSLTPDVTLRTTVLDHPPGVPTLAARWDFAGGPSITFATDTRACDAAVELARGSDLLIHEASFSTVLQPDQDPGPHCHSTAQQAGEIARRAGCRRLALVHLAPEIGKHPDVLIEEARAGTDLRVIIPEDGERLTVT
jgi:ribonuclease BN (tRNA processing enzyme)